MHAAAFLAPESWKQCRGVECVETLHDMAVSADTLLRNHLNGPFAENSNYGQSSVTLPPTDFLCADFAASAAHLHRADVLFACVSARECPPLQINSKALLHGTHI